MGEDRHFQFGLVCIGKPRQVLDKFPREGTWAGSHDPLEGQNIKDAKLLREKLSDLLQGKMKLFLVILCIATLAPKPQRHRKC